jgi:hypothetical protein
MQLAFKEFELVCCVSFTVGNNRVCVVHSVLRMLSNACTCYRVMQLAFTEFELVHYVLNNGEQLCAHTPLHVEDAVKCKDLLYARRADSVITPSSLLTS